MSPSWYMLLQSFSFRLAQLLFYVVVHLLSVSCLFSLLTFSSLSCYCPDYLYPVSLVPPCLIVLYLALVSLFCLISACLLNSGFDFLPAPGLVSWTGTWLSFLYWFCNKRPCALPISSWEAGLLLSSNLASNKYFKTWICIRVQFPNTNDKR